MDTTNVSQKLDSRSLNISNDIAFYENLVAQIGGNNTGDQKALAETMTVAVQQLFRNTTYGTTILCNNLSIQNIASVISQASQGPSMESGMVWLVKIPSRSVWGSQDMQDWMINGWPKDTANVHTAKISVLNLRTKSYVFDKIELSQITNNIVDTGGMVLSQTMATVMENLLNGKEADIMQGIIDYCLSYGAGSIGNFDWTSGSEEIKSYIEYDPTKLDGTSANRDYVLSFVMQIVRNIKLMTKKYDSFTMGTNSSDYIVIVDPIIALALGSIYDNAYSKEAPQKALENDPTEIWGTSNGALKLFGITFIPHTYLGNKFDLPLEADAKEGLPGKSLNKTKSYDFTGIGFIIVHKNVVTAPSILYDAEFNIDIPSVVKRAFYGRVLDAVPHFIRNGHAFIGVAAGIVTNESIIAAQAKKLAVDFSNRATATYATQSYFQTPVVPTLAANKIKSAKSANVLA